MAFMRLEDAISGQEGRAYATIDGNIEEMFYVRNIEATVQKTKAEGKTLGRRGTQHKATGWNGTGSMNIYYVTSRFRELMLKYIKTGQDTYFDVTIVNEDPGSSVGKQTIVLKGVNLDSVVMAKLDVDSDMLDEDVDFTFEDVDILDSFGRPITI